MKREGFTLGELVLSISITSIIGLAAAGASVALSTAYAHSESRYDRIESARSAMRQVQSALQKARLVVCVSARGDGVGWWVGDENNDGQINITELRLLRRDAQNGEIVECRVVYPDYWDQTLKDAYNYAFILGQVADYTTLESYVTMKFGAYMDSRTIATNVLAFRVSPSPSAPMTSLVGLELIVGTDKLNYLTLRSAVHLRADQTQYVSDYGGYYVLSLP